MQIVIRPLTIAVAALSLATPALAAAPNASSPPVPSQAVAQPVNTSSTKPAKSKSQPTTLVATGKIVQFDASDQALTISTSKGEQHFTLGPDARLRDSSHTISPDELGKLTGHKATVRYKESAGAKDVESVQVSSSAAKSNKG